MALIVVLLMAPVASAAPIGDTLVDQTEAALAHIDTDTTLADDALENDALLSALVMAAQAEARALSRQWWEEAQHEQDPLAAYFAMVAAQRGETFDHLRAAAEALPSDGSLDADSLEHALVAGHLVVRAEASYAQGRDLATAVARHAKETHATQRYLILSPIIQADRLADAAHGLLHNVTSGAYEVGHLMRALPEVQGEWLLPEAGPLHRFARGTLALQSHLRANATLPENTTLAAGSGAGPDAAWRAITEREAAFWLGQGSDDVAAQASLTNALAGHQAAREASLWLQEERDGGGPAWHWWALAVAVAAGTFALARRQVAAGIVVISLAGVLMAASHAEAASEPFMLSSPDMVSGAGDMTFVDGAAYIIWAEHHQGGSRLALRTLSDGEWSPIHVVRDVEADSHAPRIAQIGGDLHLLWLEDSGGEGRHIKTCLMADHACVDVVDLLPAPAPIGDHALAGGELGLAMWREETLAGDVRITVRELSPDGWGPAVRFMTGSDEQRFPAADRTGGDWHIVWRENTPPAEDGQRCETTRGEPCDRYLLARLPPGSTSASEPEEFNHTLHSGGMPAVAVADDAVHVVYGAPAIQGGNLYHRRLGTDGWTEPINITADVPGSPSWPQIQKVDGGLALGAAMLRNGESPFLFVRYQEGIWGAPREPVDAGHMVMLPSLHVRGDDVHVAFTGNRAGEGPRMKHHVSSPEGVPPRILWTDPGSGWTDGDGVRMVAAVRADSAIDHSASEWWLDGDPVSFKVGGEGLIADPLEISEGQHTARLVVADALGQVVEASWTIRVDRTPPELQFQVLRDGTPVQDGWHPSPLAVHAWAEDDDGAPVEVQWQADGGRYHDWTHEDPLPVPEGVWQTMRFRAIDGAGHVTVSEERRFGWDSTPPDAMVPAPDPIMDDRVWRPRIDIDAEGSPITTWLRMDGELSTLDADASVALEEGPHVLEIRFTDAAGNEGPWHGPWDVLVDREPPVLSVSEDRAFVIARDDGSGVVALSGPDGTNRSDAQAVLSLPIVSGGRFVAHDDAGNTAAAYLEGGEMIPDGPDGMDSHAVGRDDEGATKKVPLSWLVPGAALAVARSVKSRQTA